MNPKTPINIVGADLRSPVVLGIIFTVTITNRVLKKFMHECTSLRREVQKNNNCFLFSDNATKTIAKTENMW